MATNTRDHYTGTYGTMYYVRNMSKAVAYYKDCLGLELLHESPDWAEFKAENGKNLCIHPADASMNELPGGLIIMQVKGMKELVKKLRSNGVEVAGEPHNVHGDDYAINVIDPDGNLISLYGTL